jgi:hypothetical protein
VKPSQFAALVFGVALCLLAGLLVGGSQSLRTAVGDLLSLPEYTHQVEDARRQRREFDAASERLCARIDRKSRVITDLAAGRCSLLETMQAFQKIDRETASRDTREPAAATFCTAPDEACARAVLSWAGAELHRRPNGEQTLRQFEKELEDLIRSSALHR